MREKDNDLNEPLTELKNMKEKDSKDPILTPKETDQKLNTYYTSNLLGKTFFAWTHYAMQTANKNSIQIKDLEGLNEADQASSLIKPLYTNWYGTNDKKGYYSIKQGAFFITILLTNLCYIIVLTVVNLLINLLKYSQIYFFRELILHFKYHHNPDNEAKPTFPLYVAATAFLFIKISKTFAHHQEKFIAQVLGVKCANQVTALIYDKLMKTSIFIKNQISEGEILNFIQVDADTLNFLFTSVPQIFNVPFNFAVSLYMLFQFFGKSFIFGFVVLVVLVIIIWYIQRKFLINTKIMLSKKDKRMRLTTHTFHILKVLKLFGWEDEFNVGIDEKRKDELKNISKILNLTAVRTFVNSNIPLLISMASIGGYTYVYGAMEIADLFTSIELVEQIATPLVDIPQFITNLYSSLISMNRIQGFLNVKNINKKNYSKINEPTNTALDKISIQFRNCDFGIKDDENPSNNNVLLSHLNLTIPKGELIGVLGETGSGKTCLVNAILNNLELINDSSPDVECYICSDNISYACQDPWIMNGTIRDNILFYSEYNKERYTQVVNACQLNKDFENLLHGDLTEVGSTGTNISGGQRARIALARAIYKEADLYIFDDPISSVDTFVSMEIFHQAIAACLPNKTRLFITHDTRNLEFMDRILFLDHFKIKYFDKYNELLKEKEFKDLLEKNDKKMNKPDKNLSNISKKKHINKEDNFGRLLRDEDYVRGRITWRLYDLFFRVQGGYLLFLVLIGLTVGNVYTKVRGKIYISEWTENAEKDKDASKSNLSHFMVYSQIGFFGIFIQFVKEFLIARSNFRSTKVLHERMVTSLLKAPINLFHDIVPIGQILNRLIFDLDHSQLIIWTFDTILNSFIGLLSAVYVCYLYNSYSLYVAPILMILGTKLVNYFINSARDLNRLDGISRSPAVSLFSETILGITTIRTFKEEDPSKKKFHNRLDGHLAVMIYKYGGDNWCCIHLDMLSHLYLAFVILFSCYNIDSYTAQAVGLMLGYSSQFSEQLLETLEQSTKVEKSLVSLERCDTFTRVEPEHYDTNEVKVNENWPEKGSIKFTDFSLRYRPNCDLALEDINLTINPKEKIGIVGRTGSGKSSLTLALFRIVEALKGKIEIDNVDISKIPLNKLRRSISIVPQEPFLLEGTLKTNLDPLNLYTEEEIMEVLNQVQLFEMLKKDNANDNSYNEGINTEIKEYGNNMSFGCRQLVCFARAILRKSKIIILDEATSSVDQKTEEVITNAVDKIFKDSTVITIAHRINTVKKCDKIVVMENGKICEFDSPENLIKNENSKFYSLYYKNIEETE